MPKAMLDKFLEYLAARGQRLTGQRELIARIFFENQGHLSAEELHRRVQRKSAGVGYATVYRTIKLLADAGLAAGRSFGNGFARYEPIGSTRHHDHLICTACGKIIEFENDRIETLQESVARSHGFEVTDHNLELYGVCGECRRPRG